MSREILDRLKRKQDICIKNIIPGQNTAFMFTPALSVTVASCWGPAKEYLWLGISKNDL